MFTRVSTILCGGLLFGLLAPLAFTQAPIEFKPVSFNSTTAAEAALPRLIKDLKSDDEKIRAQAVATLGDMGATAKPAAPALIDVAVNFRGHADALKALAKIDGESTRVALRKFLVGGTRRCKCGISFSDVVAKAGEPMVPHLLILLNEKEVTESAELTLAQIGEPSVPYLVATFSGCEKQRVDPAVVRVLTRIGPKAKSASPALEWRLGLEQGAIKVRIAQALVAINGSHPAAFNVLHDALKGNDKAQQMEALDAFVRLKATSQELIPAALKILTGDEYQRQSFAMSILLNIGAPAVPALVETLGKTDAKHNPYVMYTLSNLGPKASAAVPSFIKILEGNDAANAILAAQSMPNFGPESKQAIPQLLAALKSDNFTLRRTSAQSLVQIDPEQTTHTIAPLIEVLRGNNTNERVQAMWLLRNFGAKAQAAVPTLLEMLKSEKLEQRMNIIQALTGIDNSQVDASMPTLLEALPQKKSHLPRQAVQILTSFGPKAKSAVPALKDLLKESIKGDSYISPNQVINCLKKIDGMAEVMPVVIDALNSTKADERDEAQYVVLDFLRDTALQPLEAAIANGQLRDSPQLVSLMKQLRPKTAGGK